MDGDNRSRSDSTISNAIFISALESDPDMDTVHRGAQEENSALKADQAVTFKPVDQFEKSSLIFRSSSIASETSGVSDTSETSSVSDASETSSVSDASETSSVSDASLMGTIAPPKGTRWGKTKEALTQGWQSFCNKHPKSAKITAGIGAGALFATAKVLSLGAGIFAGAAFGTLSAFSWAIPATLVSTSKNRNTLKGIILETLTAPSNRLTEAGAKIMENNFDEKTINNYKLISKTADKWIAGGSFVGSAAVIGGLVFVKAWPVALATQGLTTIFALGMAGYKIKIENSHKPDETLLETTKRNAEGLKENIKEIGDAIKELRNDPGLFPDKKV